MKHLIFTLALLLTLRIAWWPCGIRNGCDKAVGTIVDYSCNGLPLVWVDHGYLKQYFIMLHKDSLIESVDKIKS